jgi:hypothetical protein
MSTGGSCEHMRVSHRACPVPVTISHGFARLVYNIENDVPKRFCDELRLPFMPSCRTMSPGYIDQGGGALALALARSAYRATTLVPGAISDAGYRYLVPLYRSYRAPAIGALTSRWPPADPVRLWPSP